MQSKGSDVHDFKPCTELFDQSPYKHLEAHTQNTLKSNFYCLDTSNLDFSGDEWTGKGFFMSVYQCSEA